MNQRGAFPGPQEAGNLSIEGRESLEPPPGIGRAWRGRSW